MSYSRARLAVLAVLAVSAVALLIPAQSSAFNSWYNCINKPSDTWCDGRANGTYDGQHSWDYNSASNPSGIPFWVCQRVYKPSSGNWLAIALSAFCAEPLPMSSGSSVLVPTEPPRTNSRGSTVLSGGEPSTAMKPLAWAPAVSPSAARGPK